MGQQARVMAERERIWTRDAVGPALNQLLANETITMKAAINLAERTSRLEGFTGRSFWQRLNWLFRGN